MGWFCCGDEVFDIVLGEMGVLLNKVFFVYLDLLGKDVVY